MIIGIYVNHKSEAHKKIKSFGPGLRVDGHALKWAEPGLFRKGKPFPDYQAIAIEPGLPNAKDIAAAYAGIPIIKITDKLTLAETLEALAEGSKRGPGRPKKNTEAPAAGSGQNAPASPAQEV